MASEPARGAASGCLPPTERTISISSPSATAMDRDPATWSGARDGLGQHVDEDLAQRARLGQNLDALGKHEVEPHIAAGGLALDERPSIGDGVLERAGDGRLGGSRIG